MAHPTPDDLALAALGEDVAVLEHVRGCRTCHADLESLQQVVLLGRSLGPEDRLTAPDPRVWQAIAEEVHRDQVGPQHGDVSVLDRPEVAPAPSAGATDELAARRRSPVRPRRWAPVAVAAAAALVVGLGGGYLLRGLTASGSDVATTQLNALPAFPGANGTATVEDGAHGQRTLVLSLELPPDAAANGTLEVWMSDTRARDMVSMGTVSGTSARLPVPAGIDLATHPLVDVSLEPQGDSDPHHSDVSVLRGRLNV